MNLKARNCAKKLKELNLSSLLIADPVNICYLIGFSAIDSYLLLTQEQELIYFTNFLYSQAVKKLKNCKAIVSDSQHDIFTLIAEKIKQLKSKAVGFESKKLPFLEHKVIDKHLAATGIDFVETRDLIERVRMIKSKKELSYIRKSVRISEEAFELVKEIYDPAASEKDLSIEIERFLRHRGDNETAFPAIVASGKNTVFPHHQSSDKKLANDFFLIDLGSKYYGYCADLTRVFFWSKIPPLLRKIYDTLKQAQNAAIKKIKDGVRASEVDEAARELIDKKGWGKYFGHGLGHGVGLCVHEPPMLGPNCSQVLKEGMVITVEPAVYLPGRFGLRLEEMVLVKSKEGEILSGNFHR